MFRKIASAFAALTLLASSVSTVAAMNGQAVIKNLDGEDIGRLYLRETPSGIVLVTISATGLPQGLHGVHIHETGKCDAANGFKSAGGHLADNKSHGVMSENGPHLGDLPNQMVQEGGILVAEISAPPTLKLTKSGAGAVFDEDGSALIIHADRDDYTSQPSGNAGVRIACGIIEAKRD